MTFLLTSPHLTSSSPSPTSRFSFLLSTSSLSAQLRIHDGPCFYFGQLWSLDPGPLVCVPPNPDHRLYAQSHRIKRFTQPDTIHRFIHPVFHLAIFTVLSSDPDPFSSCDTLIILATWCNPSTSIDRLWHHIDQDYCKILRLGLPLDTIDTIDPILSTMIL